MDDQSMRWAQAVHFFETLKPVPTPSQLPLAGLKSWVCRPAQYRSQYAAQQQQPEIPQPETDYRSEVEYLKTEIHKPYDLPPLPHQVAGMTAKYWGAWIIADIKESWQDFCENAFTAEKLFWATLSLSVAIVVIPPVLRAVAVEPPQGSTELRQ